MAEGWSVTLEPGQGWRFLGSTPEKSASECVLRSFDGPVLFATGSGPSSPDTEPLTVAAGGGGRLLGLHFFARTAGPGGPCRILVRGI
ncbi:MAG TPA: hypothetical protein VND21_08535 [Planctomycetota bacterium]|jgi:hypothetical protein|nr:hypothetical protein [Planctomycetota bacterium]